MEKSRQLCAPTPVVTDDSDDVDIPTKWSTDTSCRELTPSATASDWKCVLATTDNDDIDLESAVSAASTD